jgi:hypothetical protein
LVPTTRNIGSEHLYKRVTTDDDGRYVVSDVAPGEYELYAWERIEAGAEYSAEFLRGHEGRAIVIRPNAAATVSLTAVRTDALR